MEGSIKFTKIFFVGIDCVQAAKCNTSFKKFQENNRDLFATNYKTTYLKCFRNFTFETFFKPRNVAKTT